jgi:hypothetical protein
LFSSFVWVCVLSKREEQLSYDEEAKRKEAMAVAE